MTPDDGRSEHGEGRRAVDSTPKPPWARGRVRLNGQDDWRRRTDAELLLLRWRAMVQGWQVSLGRWLLGLGT